MDGSLISASSIGAIVGIFASKVMDILNAKFQHHNALKFEKIRNVMQQINIAYSKMSELIHEI